MHCLLENVTIAGKTFESENKYVILSKWIPTAKKKIMWMQKSIRLYKSLANTEANWKQRIVCMLRVAMVREKVLENEKISRSGKSQGITFLVREI